MNTLKTLFDSNKKTTQILLEFQQITDFQPLLNLLSKFPELKKLSLAGNRIRELPNDMSVLTTLQQIDITNNLFPSIDTILESLQSIPNLRRLNCNLNLKQDGEKIRSRLVKLTHINGEPISRQIENFFQKQQQKHDNLIKQEDLQHVAICYDQIRQLYRDQKFTYDAQLAKDFDYTVESVMEDLSKKLKNQDSSQYILQTRVLCAKYALVNLCFTKLINFFQMADPQILPIIEYIHDSEAMIFKSLTEIVMLKTDKIGLTQYKIRKDKLRDRQLDRIKRHRDNLLKDIKELQNENQILYQKLSNFGKPVSTDLKISRKNEQTKFNGNQILNSDVTKNIKSLNLKQFKDLIEDILNSKQKYDLKCLQSKVDRETLQQYMYTYLNKKYGLKSLTIQWAMTIVYYIKKYNQQDNLVAIFGKIMRNQLNEEYYFRQKQFKKRIDDLYKISIKTKTNKLGFQIQNIFLEKSNSNVTIQECQQIVRFIHNRDDADTILQIINDKSIQPSLKINYKKDSNNKNRLIKYSDFVEILLDWNMKSYEKNIKQILYEFKKIDTDSDGIIQYQQLNKFIQKFGDLKQIDKIQKVINPNGLSHITFSQVCLYLDTFTNALKYL